VVVVERIPGALYFEISSELLTDKTRRDVLGDAVLFLDNWRIAYATLVLQERYAKERMLREKMYFERMQGIAKMVTGVAHELNTPLGVANTANSMVVSLVKDFMRVPPGASEGVELIKDIEESCMLMTKNMARAQTLIKSFKQLSASQLSDQRGEVDIIEVIQDCIETARPETKKNSLAVTISSSAAKGTPMPWIGYPSHLSQVVMNMIQNVIRYAYPAGNGGKLDIRVAETSSGYRVEFEDYGAGIAAEVEKNIFEPFNTSGRGKGGTGLGLAISHNIVTNLLKGTIKVQSTRGTGTKFTVDLPRAVPAADESS
jgi:signal transduction histidine kinase